MSAAKAGALAMLAAAAANSSFFITHSFVTIVPGSVALGQKLNF
jgi:hypothetical protein